MSDKTHDTHVSKRYITARWMLVCVLLYVLIATVATIGTAFANTDLPAVDILFNFATNPFMGLIIGIVATALIQSSSTVTSIIVALVAGNLPVVIAIPIVMGANIGTTITNTIISLGHINDKEEFRKAFSAATIHDFFNVLSVLIFLPLEILFHPLERLGAWLADFFVVHNVHSMDNFHFMQRITQPVSMLLHSMTDPLGALWGGIALVILGIALVFWTIFYIGQSLEILMVGRAKQMLYATLGRGSIRGIASGALMTALVQSSSTTTSLVIPLAGKGLFTLREIYPFTLGANIGTTITTLVAATAITNNPTALQIAMIHCLYNVLGVAVIYGLPFLRYIPLYGAEYLAEKSAERKYIALLYVVGVFFVLPAICVAVSEMLR